MRTLISAVRLVDADQDRIASVLIEKGRIAAIYPFQEDVEQAPLTKDFGKKPGDRFINGRNLVMLPSFVELHAHFRDPGYLEKETLESASLAAVAGGYGTLVCMANTKPVMDSVQTAAALKERSDSLGLIDLYPALSLTRGMEGLDTSHLKELPSRAVRLLSEDGKDVMDDMVFLTALKEAAQFGLPVSCHCDAGGEDEATERALSLALKTGGHLHLAHVSTEKAVAAVRAAKAKAKEAQGSVPLWITPLWISAEATPHHLALTEADAARLGSESFGRVNPPLRTEADRQAVIVGLLDGTLDAIATDHAPHTVDDKKAGAPGFTGLETSFSIVYTELVLGGLMDLCQLSALMSAEPSRILGLSDRGRIAVGLRADLVFIDLEKKWLVDASHFSSRGKNTPFMGREVQASVQMTLHGGRISYDRSIEK